MIKNKKVTSITLAILLTGTLSVAMRHTWFYKIFIKDINLEDVKKVTEVVGDNRIVPTISISSSLSKDVDRYNKVEQVYQNISFDEENSSLIINLKYLNKSDDTLKDVHILPELTIDYDAFESIKDFRKEIFNPNEVFEINTTIDIDELSNFKELMNLSEEEFTGFGEYLEKQIDINKLIVDYSYEYDGVEALPIRVGSYFDKKLNKKISFVQANGEITNSKINHTDDNHYLLMKSPEFKIEQNKLEVIQVKADLDKSSNLIITLTLKNISNEKIRNFTLDSSVYPYFDEHRLNSYDERNYVGPSNETVVFTKDEINIGEEFEATVKIKKAKIGEDVDYLTYGDYFEFLRTKLMYPHLTDRTLESESRFSLNQKIKDRIFELGYTYSYDTENESISISARYKPSSEIYNFNVDIDKNNN